MEEARQLFLAACEHLATQRPAEAEALLRQALVLMPGRPSLLSNLAAALMAQDKHAEALPLCLSLLAEQADNAKLWMNRGLCELALDDETAALHSLQKAAALAPEDFEAHSNLAIVLGQLGQDEAALAASTRAVGLQPDDASLMTSHGTCLRAVDRLDDARAAHLRAIALDADCVAAHWNLSLVELAMGRYAEGFARTEWRWRDPHFVAGNPVPATPRWDGTSPLHGKRLLLVAEQGLGDTLQFCRYVSALQLRGADVAIQVQPALRSLLACLPCAVHGLDEAAPAHDLHCPLMSLPGVLEVTAGERPAGGPYISAPPARLALWQERLGPKARPRIGLVWRGNQALRSGRSRSLPVALLDALLRSDLEFIALQKELGNADHAWLAAHPQVRSFQRDIRDFADTAALLSLCDQVISIDTSVAHLAGAMGKTAAILLIHAPDWRWGRPTTPGEASAWYPTLRLYRQPRPGDWQSVIDAVALHLA